VAALEFRDVHKSFGAVQALRGVSLSVDEGEIHAVVGENGAGKSTLLKILAGSLSPDRGEVFWKGERLALSGPHDALTRGIGMVYQEMLSFPDLSVTANIFAGRELTTRWGRLREAEMRARTSDLLSRLHLPVSPDDRALRLSAAYRQLLQVARALAFECRVLVLDEPTTSLTDAETDHLFQVLEGLRGRGVTLIYVSHRLPEVFRLCDRISVLRDGRHVGTFPRAGTAPARIVQAMVGRELPPRAEAAPPGREGLVRVVGLSRRPLFSDVSLTVSAGEIVGLFGLVGSGRSELVETLFGLHAADAGRVELLGRPVRFASAREAVRAGLALVPEERQRQGLFGNLSIRHNLVLPRETAGRAVLLRGCERRDALALVERWGIKAGGVDVLPDALSGGNQQKVVVAKWLATGPKVLLLDEPTKGVDVGAKHELHEIVRRQAAGGAACLVVSSDLPEVLALSHRILVMREGRIAGELAAEDADEAAVLHLATAEEATEIA
jgi:ABC-type sugar transport system ATPase subunit